jgi:hypothetical protein
MKITTGAFWLSLSTAAGAVLAQFAPWIATDGKAAIAGVGAVVVGIYTHEAHATARTRVVPVTVGKVDPIAVAPLAPPPSATLPGAGA